jgi:cytochrome P450/thioesterase domain-containing protein/predicted NAD/FAD-dependent oxidoreductase/acyl carrier protein
MDMADHGLRIAAGWDDPRLYDIGEEFRDLLVELSALAAASKVRRSRFFHTTATSALGRLEVVGDPAVPPHSFFRPGRRFRVLGRYSNAFAADDVAPSVRGLTLRLLADADGPGETPALHESLLDLPLNTGGCFYAGSADVFRRSQLEGPARDAVLLEAPHLRETLWDSYRTAVSFASYHYYSQVPRCYLDTDGRCWLVRYRLLPAGQERTTEVGRFDPGQLRFPPDIPDQMTRPAGDPRPPTYLHEELRDRLATGGVAGVLQIQLRPLPADPVATDAALDGSRPWSEEEFPWLALATLRLDAAVDDHEVEGLRFSPGLAPPELGIALARSPREAASVNHLRVLLYQMTSAARLETPMPPPLADLLRPRRAATTVERAAPPRRVCVIGAGPSGLAAARELERAGHTAIVLEAGDQVGGKCASVQIDGRAYDLGGHLCTTAYEQVAQLITDLDVDTEDTTQHRVYDVDTGEAVPQSAAFFRRDVFRRYTALRGESFPRIGEPGLAHSARALAAPAREWLAEHGLEPLAASLGTGYTAAGYGFLDGDLPALYLVKYAELTGLLSSTPEMLGHTGSFTVAGGFDNLWKRVARGLREVRTGVVVRMIRRDRDGVSVITSRGEIRVDDLVLTVPLDQVLPLLDATDEEREVAAAVRYLDYRTTVCTATGLPRSGFYLLQDQAGQGNLDGHLVSFHHRYPDTDVYALYSYGLPYDGPDEDRLRQDVERLGGRLEEVHTWRRWRFMPHFDSEAIRAGMFERLEQLQGVLHTYHVGSLPSFELVECNVAFTQDLVRRSFPPTGVAIPRRPAEPDTAAAATHTAPAAGPSREQIRTWLVERIAAELDLPVEDVDPAADLAIYGLESLTVAILQGALSDWLGFRVSHTLLLELPTVDDIAGHLADSARADEPAARSAPPSLLLPLSTPRPFFFVGGIVGAAYYLRPLALDLGLAEPFYALQGVGLDGHEDPPDNIEELAARYVEEIRQVQHGGPYRLGGHSFGGLVAYEMARQLEAAGETIEQVILLDTYLPERDQRPPDPDVTAAIGELAKMNALVSDRDLGQHASIDPTLSVEEQMTALGRAMGASGALPVTEHLANMIYIYHTNFAGLVDYVAEPVDFPVTLLRAEWGFPLVMGPRRTILSERDGMNGWRDLNLPKLRVIDVPGDHFSVLVEPYRPAVAATIRRCLQSADPAGAVAADWFGMPKTDKIDFEDDDFLQNPHPVYRRLRESDPVYFCRDVNGWVLTRHADVHKVLRDSRAIRPQAGDMLFSRIPADIRAGELAEFEHILGTSLPFSNPPEHTHLRKLVAKAFTPRLIEAQRKKVIEITDRLLDAMEAAGRADIIRDLAYPLPNLVVMDFIGVPEEDQAQTMAWAPDIMAVIGQALPGQDPIRVARAGRDATMAFCSYLRALIGVRRLAPRPDLLSELIAVTDGQHKLTEDELIVFVLVLLIAGLETTSQYVGNGVHSLLLNPDKVAELRTDESIVETAAEELLRFDGPIPITSPQILTADVEIEGRVLPKGHLVYLSVAAANRDPEVFADPDELDLRRGTPGVLSFGAGIHYCLGAALARMEGQEAFSRIVRRFPNMHIDPNAEPPVFRKDPILRGLKSLHVTW